MRKKIFSALLLLAFAVPYLSHAIPVHNIGLNVGVSMPGEKEIKDFHNLTSDIDAVNCYNLGLDYTFAPIEYFSIGAGCNYLMRSYILSISPYEYTVNYAAIEPYGQLRAYYPIMQQIDVFAGGAAGYAILAGSTSKANTTPATTYELAGSGLTYRFGGGLTYSQGMFTTMIEAGYKIAKITPFTYSGGGVSGTAKNNDGSDAGINFGGLFFNVNASLSFGSRAEAKNDGEIRKQLDNDVNSLDTFSASSENAGQEADAETSSASSAAMAEETALADAAETPAAEDVAAAEPTAEPVKEEPVAEKKNKSVEIAEDEGNDEGIILLSPGETELSQLEKYMVSKRKQFKPEEEGEERAGGVEGEEGEAAAEGAGEEGGGTTFIYEPEDSGIVLLEAESKGKVERAGYVLVERGGFISPNFTADGTIYALDEHKEYLSAPDFAYIKLTVGKGAPVGREFTVYDDSEEVYNEAAGGSMGRLIKFMGVVKVVSRIEDNIYKVQIKKSYDLIKNDFKIKARNDLKKYHKEISFKVRKKNLAVEAFIIKVLGDVIGLKDKDLVYIDAGINKGLLPGEKMGIFRQTSDAASGKEEKYHRLGTMIVLNSVQRSAVGVIIKQDDIIKVGDIVKTLAK